MFVGNFSQCGDLLFKLQGLLITQAVQLKVYKLQNYPYATPQLSESKRKGRVYGNARVHALI